MPVILALLVLLTSISPGDQMSPEAQKYHQMLQKRPQAGVIYERFYGAWLETGTADELAKFLSQQASAANSTPADHLLLATFHEQQGDETAALIAFKTALAREAANCSAWVQRAKLEARVLDFASGLTSLAEAEKHKPSSDQQREIGTLRGRWLLRTGKPEPALQAWRDLLATHAEDEDLAEEVIELQMDEGLHGEAEAQMTALITRTTDAYDKTLRQLRLAEIMMRGGKQQDALKAMADALNATGQGSWIEGEVLAQLEAVFRKDENLSGLSAHLAELAKAHPQRIALQKAQARVLAELGEKDQALTLFAAILEKTPGERELREGYLDLLERFEMFKEGIEQTNVLLTQSPNDRELLIRLATLQERAKDSTAAKATVERYLNAQETTEFDHLRAARLFESWERNEEASTAYETMVKTFPESVAAKEARAHYLHRSGRKEAAIAIWATLGKEGDLTQALAVGQALMARGEPASTLAILQERVSEFSQNERFLGLLVNAALADKRDADAATWALARIRATPDLQLLDDALKQIVIATQKDGRREQFIADLKKQPTLTPAERVLLATLLEESGDLANSEAALREMPAEHALAAQGRLVRLMERRQDWLRAYDEARKLTELPGGRTSNNIQRCAELAERNGKADEALKFIADWKTLAPSSPQPWLNEARLLRLDGKIRESLQLLRSAARKFEDNEAVVSALASAYAELGQMADAERIYLTRFEEAEQPEDKMRWVASIATLASMRGQLKALTEKFQERQRNNRNDAGPWLALAEVHRIGENPVEQERALREALRLRPEDLGLAQQLARVDLDMGQWKRALETLERVATKDKGTRIRQMMAAIQIEYGDSNAGYRQMYEIAGGAKMDMDDAVTIVKSMTAKQDWERAIAFLEPLVTQHPLDYRLGYLLAVSLEEAGRADEAARHFTRILSQKEERPGAKPAATNSQSAAYAAYWATMEKTMPPDAWAYFNSNMSGGGYQAYQYRQAQRYAGPGNSGAVSEPTALEMCRSYSTPHLAGVIKSMPEPQATAAWAAAKASGIQHTEILSVAELDQYGQMTFPSDEGEMSESMMAIKLMMNSESGASNFDFATTAYERFQHSYPGLALKAAFAICQVDIEKGSQALDQVITKMLAAPEKESVTSAWQLANFLGGSQSMKDGDYKPELPPATRDKCLALLLKHLDSIDTVSGSGTYSTAVPHILNACRHQEAWDTVIMLLEREMRLHKEHPATASSWASWGSRFSSRRSIAKLLAPLPFPFHSSIPYTLSFYFRRLDPYNPTENEKSEPEDTYQEVAKRIEKLTHPVLRAVVAFKAADDATAEKEITQMLEEKDSGVDALLFAASWYALKEDHQKSAELLIKASAMDIPASSRPAVDAALAFAVTSITSATKPEWQEPTQMALRRLRSARTTSKQNDELVLAMKAVGLGEEADQWSKLASVAPPTQNTSRRFSNNSHPDTTKLKQLLGTKEEEAIAREAVVQLKRCLTYASNGSQRYAAREAQEIYKLIDKPALQTKVNAAFATKEDSTSIKLLEYASFLELTARQTEATAVLEKLIARDQNQHLARLRLFTMVAAKEPERALTLLMAVPARAFQNSGLGDQILDLLSDRDTMPFPERMTFFSTLAAFLDSTPAKGGQAQSLEWMIDLPRLLANSSYRKPRLPHLSWRTGQTDGNDEPFLADDSPEAKKRLEVMAKLCAAFMKHPMLAAEGFRWHAMLGMKQERPAAELAALATQTLTTAKASRNRTPLSGRYSQEETGRWTPTPAEYLLWLCWKQNEPEKWENEVLPLATSSLDTGSLSALCMMKEVLFCIPDDFPAKAKALMAAADRSRNRDGAIVWLIDRWEERDLPGTPLDTVILEKCKSDGDDYSNAQDLSHYLAVRARLRPQADEKDFAHRLTQAFLGNDPTKWEDELKPSMQAYYGQGGSYSNRKAYSYLSLVRHLMETPESINIGMHLATMTGQNQHAGWVRSNSSEVSQAAQNKATAVPTLRSLGWLGEAESLIVEKEVTGLRHKILQELAAAPPSTKGEIRPLLTTLKPQTFGVELVIAFLAEDPASELTNLLKRRAADLNRLPEASRAGLSILIKSQIPALSTPASADQALVTALQPLLAEELKRSNAELDQWLIASSSDKIESDDEAYDKKVQDFLAKLILSDPDKATQFFLKASELMEAKAADKGWEGSASSNGWTNRSTYVERTITKLNKTAAFAWAMKLWHEDTSGELACSGWSQSNGFGQPLLDIWRSKGGNAAMGHGIDPILDRLSEAMKDTPHSLLPLAFYDFIAKLPEGQRPEALRYAAKITPSSPHSALARELDYAARFFLATDPTARTKPHLREALTEVGGMAPVWEHYRAKLADTKLNARVRQALGHHLIYRAREFTDPTCIKLAAAAALESQKAKHCLHGYQYAWILFGFNQLPLDDEWKAQAQAYWDAWVARNAQGGFTKYSPHDWPINSTLRMAARSGHEEWARTLISKFHETLSNEPSGLASLIMGGMPKLAAEHFASEWRGFSTRAINEINWCQAIQDGLPAFKEACPDSATAYLGELYLSSLKDPTQPEQEAIQGFKNKTTRIRELAAKFKEVAFTDEEMRRDAVALICTESNAAFLIQDAVREFSAATDLNQFATSTNTSEYSHQLKPLQLALAFQAAAGDAKPAIEAYDRALAVNFDHEYYHRNLVKEIGWGPITFTPQQWTEEFKTGKSSQTKELLPFLDHVITKTPGKLRDTHIADAIALKWLIHLLHNDESSFAQWRKALKPDDAKSFYSLCNRRWEIWKMLQRYCTPDDKVRLTISERLPLVVAILKHEWTIKRYPSNGSNIPNLITHLCPDAKVFKIDELVEVAKDLALALPRTGRTAMEAAAFLANNDKLDPAVPLFALAFEQARKEKPNDYKLAASFAIRQAETLERLSKASEALKVLQALEFKRAGEDNQRTITAAIQRLSTKAENN